MASKKNKKGKESKKTEKSLRQQQLDSIAELEQEMIATCHRHFETLQILKAKGLTENEQYKPPKHMMFELYLKAKKEASFYILSYIREISWENHHLHDELQHLVERAQSLHKHQQILQTHRRDLLLEREVQGLQNIHTSIAVTHTTVVNKHMSPVQLILQVVKCCNKKLLAYESSQMLISWCQMEVPRSSREQERKLTNVQLNPAKQITQSEAGKAEHRCSVEQLQSEKADTQANIKAV
ncbi:hypothetical protein C0J50_20525 [Silurus asotus]|uniref:Uncharacterized protein n=1 Tax=Silurus asotus TaxID=30991 RepID=A0AAD5FLC1_SILAS|nr:hypothetical protein C0J50_20525 [Silurus asotus]